MPVGAFETPAGSGFVRPSGWTGSHRQTVKTTQVMPEADLYRDPDQPRAGRREPR